MKQPAAPAPITIDEIAVRAREIWQRHGAPPGRNLDYWLQAENELVFEREQAAQALRRMERTNMPPDDGRSPRTRHHPAGAG